MLSHHDERPAAAPRAVSNRRRAAAALATLALSATCSLAIDATAQEAPAPVTEPSAEQPPAAAVPEAPVDAAGTPEPGTSDAAASGSVPPETVAAPNPAAPDSPAAEPQPVPKSETAQESVPNTDNPDAEISDDSAAGEAAAPGGVQIGDALVTLKARLMAGFEYEVERPAGDQPQAGRSIDDYGFFAQQARLGLDAEWGKRFRVQIEADFERGEEPAAGLKDAWLNYRLDRAFQVKLGRFKRPFSRLELRSAGKLPIRSRGVGNDLIVEDIGYGDRSQGVELWGRFKDLDLDWSVAVSDPPAANRGVDVHGRVAWDAHDTLELGVGGAHKVFRQAQLDPNRGASALGADVRFELGGLYLLLDALLAEDARFQRRADAGSVAGYASYDIPLSKAWALQPVVFGEWTDSDLEYSESEVARAVVGLNLLWHEHTFRIMPQAELVRPLSVGDDTVWVEKDSYYILFAGEL